MLQVKSHKDKNLSERVYRVYSEIFYSELTVHFQPIFESKKFKIYGYESLARHVSKKINIGKLFLEAKKNDSIFLLDMICREKAIREASKQNLKDYLFINICPETIISPQHEIGITDRLAEKYNFPKEKIILEITEQSAIENYEIFIKTISYYKERGYRIAIDDFGSGYGGPKLLSLIKPDIVKIDKHFIQTLNDNYFSKCFVEFVINLCNEFGIMVVAEGIETSLQLEKILEKNADLLQGYYLGEPAAFIRNSFQDYGNQ
ncbi:MAG: EAL domain-containing protein [Thermodesulfovibrio sp.]|nr:EAL domain-containing protein [Thermodesulfovibrio sp.]